MLSKLQQAARHTLKNVRLAWFNLMLGEVSFDEEMDCYWQGHAASMQNPLPRNPHVHPARRDAYNAGVAMERWALESDDVQYPTYGMPQSSMRDLLGAGQHLELQPST